MGKRKATQVRAEHEAEDRSPIPYVVPVGSGGLLALVKGELARPLIAVMISREDVEPHGTMLCIDVPIEPEDRLPGTCMNAAAALLLAIWGSVETTGAGNVFMHGGLPFEILSPAFKAAWQADAVIDIAPDLFLMQYRTILQAADEELRRQPGGLAARETRADAAERVQALNNWAMMSQVNRSGGVSSAPVLVPVFVVQHALDLARLGQRLASFEREAEGLAQPNWGALKLAPLLRTRLIKRHAREVGGGITAVAESVARSCVPPVEPGTVRRWINRQKAPEDLVAEILRIQSGRT